MSTSHNIHSQSLILFLTFKCPDFLSIFLLSSLFSPEFLPCLFQIACPKLVEVMVLAGSRRFVRCEFLARTLEWVVVFVIKQRRMHIFNQRFHVFSIQFHSLSSRGIIYFTSVRHFLTSLVPCRIIPHQELDSSNTHVSAGSITFNSNILSISNFLDYIVIGKRRH